MAGPKAKSILIEEMNSLDYPDFISHFGSVIEHGALAAASVWSARPFSSAQALHQAFEEFLFSLSPRAKEGVIRCYPDLAGKLAEENRLTEDSQKEHRAAGLLEMSENEKAELRSLNFPYKKKFSFPFVICAMENKKEAIMRGIRARLENKHSEEVDNALKEISKIAYHRIINYVVDNASKM